MRNRFILENDQTSDMIIVAEPEACELRLAKNEQVLITDDYDQSPVVIRVTSSPTGEPVLSVWPGDGDVRIEKNGVDILDIVQQTSNARSA